MTLSFSPLGAAGQRVKVEAEVLSYPGQTVNLRCAFTDATGIQLTMVRFPQTGCSFTLRILLLLYTKPKTALAE